MREPSALNSRRSFAVASATPQPARLNTESSPPPMVQKLAAAPVSPASVRGSRSEQGMKTTCGPATAPKGGGYVSERTTSPLVRQLRGMNAANVERRCVQGVAAGETASLSPTTQPADCPAKYQQGSPRLSRGGANG